MKINGINRTVTIPTQIQIFGTCGIPEGMRRELHEFGRKREVRGTSVLPPSRRLLQAQVAGAVLVAVKTIKSHDIPSNPKVFKPKKSNHGGTERPRTLQSATTGAGRWP